MEHIKDVVRGRLYVVGGPDDANAALADRLHAELRDHGRSAVVKHWKRPPGNSIGFEVRTCRDATDFPALAWAVAMAAARIWTIEGSVLPALDAGIDVVLDHYWWTAPTVHHATIEFPLAPKLLLDLELLAWRSREPQAVFLLDRMKIDMDGTVPDGRPERTEPPFLSGRVHTFLEAEEAIHYLRSTLFEDGNNDFGVGSGW